MLPRVLTTDLTVNMISLPSILISVSELDTLAMVVTIQGIAEGRGKEE